MRGVGGEGEERHSRDLKHSSRGRCMPLFGLSKLIFLGSNEVVPATACKKKMVDGAD